ncbi:MAG: hypothetical protein AB7K24_16815 [Gemmataceae bacterium]
MRYMFTVIVVLIAGSFSPGVDPLTPYEKVRASKEELIRLPELEMRFGDFIEEMRLRANVPIVIDEQAFARAGIKQVRDEYLTLPELNGVSMGTVLRFAASKTGDGTMIQQGNTLWIVPCQERAVRMFRQPVDVEFVQKPVKEALAELKTRTGADFEIDDDFIDKNAPFVNAHFRGVAVEDAVEEVARQAGLRVIRHPTCLFVTTPERARELDAPPDL